MTDDNKLPDDEFTLQGEDMSTSVDCRTENKASGSLKDLSDMLDTLLDNLSDEVAAEFSERMHGESEDGSRKGLSDIMTGIARMNMDETIGHLTDEYFTKDGDRWSASMQDIRSLYIEITVQTLHAFSVAIRNDDDLALSQEQRREVSRTYRTLRNTLYRLEECE